MKARKFAKNYVKTILSILFKKLHLKFNQHKKKNFVSHVRLDALLQTKWLLTYYQVHLFI